MNIQADANFKSGLFTLLVLLIGVSCTNNAPKEQTPTERIDAVLNSVEPHLKTIGTQKYAPITNMDTLQRMVIDDATKARYNLKMKFFMTEDCLKERRLNNAEGSNAESQFTNDSTYLTAIRERGDEMERESINMGDTISLLDIIIKTEKVKILINEMNKVCPTAGGEKLLE